LFRCERGGACLGRRDGVSFGFLAFGKNAGCDCENFRLKNLGLKFFGGKPVLPIKYFLWH
jgi:hypothetical protein